MSPKESTEVRVEVDGRTLKLSNLDKVLYPRTGTTKGEVLNYYAQVVAGAAAATSRTAAVDPRCGGRNGVEKQSFFEKNVPGGHAVVGAYRRGADDRLAGPLEERRHPGLPGRRRPGHADLAGQPRRARAARAPVDRRPGRHGPGRRTASSSTSTRATGAGLHECCQVALLVRERLAERDLETAGRSRAAARACTCTPPSSAARTPTTPPRWPRRSPRTSPRSTAGW